MSFPYAVVQFPKEGTYSEIPTSWLTKDLTQCKWPTTKNATFFLKKNSPPEKDWLLFDIKVECYCETFEKARKKAEDAANYATSCDEIKGRGKRVVHEKQIDDSCVISDKSTDDDCDSPPQLYKTAHKKLKIDKVRDSSGKKSLCDKQLSHEMQSSCENVSQFAIEKSFSMTNRSLCSRSQTRKVDPLQASELNDINELLTFQPEEINVQKNLISICVETLKYVKSIDKRLKIFERGINEKPLDIFDDLLPIDSIQNLKRFEENIESAETKADFVEFIKRIEGKGVRNLVQRCMSHLFTNEFGIACSWYGRGENYRMCDLKCIRILKDIIKAKGVDECEFETIASEWFRFSKLRYDRESKKEYQPLKTDDEIVILNINSQQSKRSSQEHACSSNSSKSSVLKRKDNTMTEEVHSVMKCPSSNIKEKDEFDIFGEYVASTIRNLRSKFDQATAKYRISNILYEMEIE